MSDLHLILVQDWLIQRTLDACRKHCTGKTTDQRQGCIHEPLLSIPFDRAIIDTLHLFLRIMGLLFHQVKTFIFFNEANLFQAIYDILIYHYFVLYCTSNRAIISPYICELINQLMASV